MDIDRLNIADTLYVDWFCDYLLANKPCIFTSSITEGWLSRKEWVSNDGAPDWHLLARLFGNAEVPVIDTGQTNSTYDSQLQSRMKFSDFVLTQTANQNRCSLYLKDWHFFKEFPKYEAYQVPIYFRNDWMNEYWDAKNDPVEVDYRFVYIGGKDTWTMFHADVFRSYSWSANVCGQKRWILVKPGTEERFDQPPNGRNTLSPMNDVRHSISADPALRQNGLVLDVIQEPGEIIFVPTNWHHQVHNLNNVISINHNWCNGANIPMVLEHINQRLDAVKKETLDCRSLSDTKSWFRQCQLILKCDTGIDFLEALSMLDVIAQNRACRLANDRGRTSLEKDLFHCNSCDNDLSLCQRLPECLEGLKRRLHSQCTCKGGASSLCDFCSRFFGMFDLKAITQAMISILCTEDAQVLSDTFAPWKSRLLAITQMIDDFFTENLA